MSQPGGCAVSQEAPSCKLLQQNNNNNNMLDHWPRTTSKYLKREGRRFCSKETLLKRLPITTWLPKYDLECLEGDIMAGCAVGLTLIPQSMAYAAVAGLTPNYGLYSAFMGCLVYVIMGTCKEISIGPTAINALMTYEYSRSGGPEYAVLLCFLNGLIILAAAMCNLGFLINFISRPVICAFTSAAAITIASTQIKGLFGLSFKSNGILDTYVKIFQNIGDTRWQDLTLGLSTIVVLLLMKRLKDMKAAKVRAGDTLGTRMWKKVVFLVSIGRNAIVVIIGLVTAYLLDDHQPFIITGEVVPGLPAVRLPQFTAVVNGTTLSFGDILEDIGSGVAIIPILSILGTVAIANAFCGGKTLDAKQEMYALGFCNLLGSFVQSMPVTGSFSRTAVNATSGVKTTAGGIITSVLVMLALAFLTSHFKFIPKASLSAVIMCAVLFMVEYEMVAPIWRARRLDQLPLWVTFLACLFWKVEYGILVGVAVDLALLLYSSAIPKINVSTIKKEDGVKAAYVLVEPCTGLFFPSVDYVRAAVNKAGISTAEGSLTVVLDCCHLTGLDFTAVKGIEGLCSDFQKRQQPLILANASPNIKKSLACLDPHIKITSTPEELHSLLRCVSQMDAVTTLSNNCAMVHSNSVVCAMVHSNTAETCSGEEFDMINPLLQVTTSAAKPSVCDQPA